MTLQTLLPATSRDVDAPRRRQRILVFSSPFPSSIQPIHGVFVKERVRNVAELPGCDVRVVSPVPFFPPIRRFKRWYPLSQIPREETIDGLGVVHPRYCLPPEVGCFFHSVAMARASYRTIARIRRDFDFDVIDAHFVYPEGAAAAQLARRFNKPLVITCRGEDILRFPRLPVVGRRIRRALKKATALVALSGEIADAMKANGAEPAKITVIPNGVDCAKFRPVARSEARRRLELPDNRPIVLSVGYRLERKGFHLLVDAVPQIRKRFPNVLVVVVGGQARWGQDYTSVIEERIRAGDVGDCVRLVGARRPEELPLWYSAADVFALLTSREGSPNVVMESLSCGLPVVATPVGGIPEVLSEAQLGLLLGDRSPATAADGIVEALSRSWDRSAIRRAAEKRSWQATAEHVHDVFDRVISQV